MFQAEPQTVSEITPFRSIFDKWHDSLFESENFVAIPSAGALVEGWLLVIPKRFHIAIGSIAFDEVRELKEFVNHIKATLESLYGNVLIFEHGPTDIARPVGCSIDYAHLHMVPFEQGIFSTAKEMFPLIKWSRAAGLEKCLEYYRLHQDYLYVEDPFEGAFISNSPNLPSQLFRRVIAEKLKVAEKYDWRLYPEEPNIRATVDRIHAATLAPHACLKAF
jgi:diadenosine tetraphosphate (Ap4A) HIT family hydrolase